MNACATPVLSVVMAVHNLELFLADALTSLRNNARADFEFVVVDDGSTDSTADILDAYRAELPMMNVVRNDRVRGLADARNIGLDHAQGRYVTFLDGDDWLAPGYLTDLVDAIDRLQCDFVRVDHIKVEGRSRVPQLAPVGRRGVVLNPRDHILPAHQHTMVDYPYAWAGVYRRELGDLLRFPAGLHTAEDRPWIWRLHREVPSFAVVSLAGVFYRRLVPTSLTQVGDERQFQFFDAFELVFADLTADARAGDDLWTKAVRQFISVLAHHLDTAEQIRPHLRSGFERRGRSALAALPRDLVLGTPLSEERAAVIGPLLPAARVAEFTR